MMKTGYTNGRAALIAMLVILGLVMSLATGLIGFRTPPATTPGGTNDQLIHELPDVVNFKTEEDLEAFIREHVATLSAAPIPEVVMTTTVRYALDAKLASSFGTPSLNQASAWYSVTNVQVAGIDEIDFFKSDGKFFYIVGREEWSNSTSTSVVYIAEVYPPNEMHIVSNISLINTTVIGLYVIPEANRLVLITTARLPYIIRCLCAEIGGIAPPQYVRPNTTVMVFDISDRSKPELVEKTTVSGNFRDSRLWNNVVYVITTDDVYGPNQSILLPMLDGKEINVEDIKAVKNDDVLFPIYVNVLAINAVTGERDVSSFLLQYPQWIYMSKGNIYILSTEWFDFEGEMTDFIRDAVLPKLPPETAQKIVMILSNESMPKWRKYMEITDILASYWKTLTPEEQRELAKFVATQFLTYFKGVPREITRIYRIGIKGTDSVLAAYGKVPGRVTDQFSMDEYNDYFRIATTVSRIKEVELMDVQIPEDMKGEGLKIPYPQFKESNNVYVLDMNLSVVGAIEDIEPGETIYSARFMGDYMFLVTFRRVDPLFAINLSDPSKPEIIGYIKIPGYSEYLHPYGDHYLIGVGLDADKNGRIKGVKVSLFDVSDLENIKEVSSLRVTEQWAWSPVLGDHKAFLLNPVEDYLAIPVLGVFKESGELYKGSMLFVVKIDDESLKLLGTVELDHYASRTAYIHDTLYAVSQEGIAAITYPDLSIVGSIHFQ